MSSGLETTIRFLAKTKNDAALGLLLPALDAPHAEIREGALQAILDRKSPIGGKEILSRLPKMDERWKAIINDRPGRLSNTLRDAILGTDQQPCENACQAVLWFHEYDMMPVLLTTAEDEAHPHIDLAATTLLQLAKELDQEISLPRDYRNRRDPQAVRRRLIVDLEKSTSRFAKHRRAEILESFLTLATRDSDLLRIILLDFYHDSYLALIDIMTHSVQRGVIDLVLSFLDVAEAPSSAIKVLAHRHDQAFAIELLEKIGNKPSSTVRTNLRRIESIAWLQGGTEFIKSLDDEVQAAAVRFVMVSGTNRTEAFQTLTQVLQNGKPSGRLAAAEALADFSGSEANQLALDALMDDDPRVQAAVIPQLRHRNMPGIMQKLFALLDSPEELIRETARENLSDYNFKRFLGTFDTLEDEVRTSDGPRIKKVDLSTVPKTAVELKAESRTRRLRGLAIADCTGAAPELETEILELVAEEDHMIRTEAAYCLAHCDTPQSRKALRNCLLDRSVSVQEAAEYSLQILDPEGKQTADPTLNPTESPMKETT